MLVGYKVWDRCALLFHCFPRCLGTTWSLHGVWEHQPFHAESWIHQHFFPAETCIDLRFHSPAHPLLSIQEPMEWKHSKLTQSCTSNTHTHTDIFHIGLSFLQRYRGVEFNTVAAPAYIDINLSHMSPCLITLKPEDCLNDGATFMFWIKLMDDNAGTVMTTRKNESTGGWTIWINENGRLVHKIAYSVEPRPHKGFAFSFQHFTNIWVHVALVKLNDNFWMNVYQNGSKVPVTNEQEDITTTVDDYVETLALGKVFVSVSAQWRAKNMILDEIILCNKPLSKEEINQMINLWTVPVRWWNNKFWVQWARECVVITCPTRFFFCPCRTHISQFGALLWELSWYFIHSTKNVVSSIVWNKTVSLNRCSHQIPTNCVKQNSQFE